MNEKEAWLELARLFDTASKKGPRSTMTINGLCWAARNLTQLNYGVLVAMLKRLRREAIRRQEQGKRYTWFWPSYGGESESGTDWKPQHDLARSNLARRFARECEKEDSNVN